MARMRLLRLVSCESGTTAVEFALVATPFFFFFLGILSACLAVFASASLQYAAEGAARCYSIGSQCSSTNSTLCSTATTTQSCAQTLYRGPNSPTFSASTPACGHQVSATLNYVLNAGVAHWTIPMSATACFP